MLRPVTLVRTDVSEERIASIRLKTISELVFLRSLLQLLVTPKVPSLLILFMLMMEAILSFETTLLTRATRRNIPEDGILLD
jgi:hypothetical protein